MLTVCHSLLAQRPSLHMSFAYAGFPCPAVRSLDDLNGSSLTHPLGQRTISLKPNHLQADVVPLTDIDAAALAKVHLHHFSLAIYSNKPLDLVRSSVTSFDAAGALNATDSSQQAEGGSTAANRTSNLASFDSADVQLQLANGVVDVDSALLGWMGANMTGYAMNISISPNFTWDAANSRIVMHTGEVPVTFLLTPQTVPGVRYTNAIFTLTANVTAYADLTPLPGGEEGVGIRSESMLRFEKSDLDRMEESPPRIFYGNGSVPNAQATSSGDSTTNVVPPDPTNGSESEFTKVTGTNAAVNSNSGQAVWLASKMAAVFTVIGVAMLSSC